MFIRKLMGLLGRAEASRDVATPPGSKSLIYALCAEYKRLDLWAAYHAFRLDPQADNWKRLRRRNVPWQRRQTVGALMDPLCALNGKRTPDPATVALALVNGYPTASARPGKSG